MNELPAGLNSRDRILWAAATLLGEGPGAALSVRRVAARAEVSTGSLRHHFPTQRALMDAVLPLVYDLVFTDDGIHDATIAPRDRLVAALQRLLAPEGADTRPREDWLMAIDRYVRTEPTEATRAEYLAIERELHRRIEYCLGVLREEGALAEGDDARRARYLMTVVTGLSVAQAFPADDTRLQTEIDVLYMAVDSVLRQ
jgi:AcrR family transcriptional regulator